MYRPVTLETWASGPRASPGGCAMESRRRVTFAQRLRIYCNPAGSLILDT